MSSAAIAASAAAQAYKQQCDEEEEHMSNYSADDLANWEFKIVRSAASAFGSQEKLQAMLQEEQQAGWEFVEKFDDSRVRLRRKKSERDKDVGRTINPYRSYYGMSSNVLVFWIMGVAVLCAVVILLIAVM